MRSANTKDRKTIRKKDVARNNPRKQTTSRPLQRKPNEHHGSEKNNRKQPNNTGNFQKSRSQVSAVRMDPHLASKVFSDLKRDISNFKQHHSSDELIRCADTKAFFGLIPPYFIYQRIPSELKSFSRYLAKFEKGCECQVSGFLLWYEWASYEVAKGTTYKKKERKGESDAVEEESQTKFSETRQVLAKTYKEREHVRSLLKLCTRHNAEQRRAGQHAFINYINSKLADEGVDFSTLEALKATVHHSVAYAIVRLILGMTEENLFLVLLNFHALFLIITRTPIPPKVVLSIINEEFNLEERMKACRIRLLSKTTTKDVQDDDIDPDDINDSTKGERNQLLVATIFSLAAIVVSKKRLSPETSFSLAKFLNFCYVEQKAARVISANLLFQFLQRDESILRDEEAFQWLTFSFFSIPKMEYYRPETFQLLFLLMGKENLPTHFLPDAVLSYLKMDPLEPSCLEQICVALFRKEQVTAVHPMIHPVWDDLINLMITRCEQGESMKAHFTSFVHTAIVPYRRGNSDLPRRALFQSLVSKLGQIAVRNKDAHERLELLHMASKNAGYGRNTAAKPSTAEELRQLPLYELGIKVDDLILQYRSIRDSDPAAFTNRRWVLRELRGCLSVPMNYHMEAPHVNKAVTALLEFGFFPPFNSRDSTNMNRCIYLFSDFFSFTYSGTSSRIKCSLKGIDIISQYLREEEKGKTRFRTALMKSSFRKARNQIVDALENRSKRSVLFYDDRNIEILLTLLFLILSVDDPSNAEANTLASTIVPDMVYFYQHGTIETMELLYDIMMALVMRNSLPVQVLPIMSCVKRIAVGTMLKCAKSIRGSRVFDIILSPLREAYHTDSREQLRRNAKVNEEESSADEDEEDNLDDTSGDDDDDADKNSVEQSNDDDEDSQSQDSSTSSETETAEDLDSEDTEGRKEREGDADDIPVDDDPALESDDDMDSEDDSKFTEEEAPTQQYIDALKGMIGDVDLEHSYPRDTFYHEKQQVVKAIQIAARVARACSTPYIIQVFQVLLAVARENVKGSDESIFNSSLVAIDFLLLTKNRYFGDFQLEATSLFQILGDIQSYCRKSVKSLLQGSNITPKAAAAIRYRMGKLKLISLRVYHFISFLAFKNHADEAVRIVLFEYYKSIFCDRGWQAKTVMGSLKEDLYHYRQGYVWALLPAIFEKYSDLSGIDGVQRTRVFSSCLHIIEAMLPRLTRLPNELKQKARENICGFLQSFSLEQVYAMKKTMCYFFLHTIRMVLKYNSRVHLDEEWVKNNIVNVAVDRDDIQMTGATIRLLSSMERLLRLTPRASETKAPVPMKSLFQDTSSGEAPKKRNGFQSSKRFRSKTIKRYLSSLDEKKNLFEGASAKRLRKEELRMKDQLQRQVLRDASKKNRLSKEEREEKRKRMLIAKQERIVKNKERKRRLHELRQKSFARWREQKIAQVLSDG